MAAPVHRGSESHDPVVSETETNMPALKSLAKCAVSPLTWRVIAECPVTKARACDLSLPHCVVDTPVFMPVGTQGTMKGITADQLEDLGWSSSDREGQGAAWLHELEEESPHGQRRVPDGVSC
ncbi:hypothetical protein NHX12_032186 [Muraenolepis orangiensis]|uniref:tRNA-guanine(15) transglycosylase-like domain-containing protein n=1 Tax=Muraenolepis orangiensis TaxID=630683 RepID=A0A9Q0IKD1_9TELE|nr:hypothetical protein NHX12_032186 [Muraenolepis orangiensis]